EELTADQQKHILGAQANIWTEYIPNFKQVQYMAMPRVAAMSEVQWTQPEKKNYERFLTRLPRLIDIYEALNYNYAKHLFNVPTMAPANK
ncbi:MAG: family 20 glycosylhydrolase, partial [Bacteroidales bacterium]|nr:family 20 glycosylhydrolase [Bacteroidales bacterium]